MARNRSRCARSEDRPDELSLFRRLGLRDIRMYPFAHLICYSDAGIPLEYRRALALEETREEIEWLKSRYAENAPAYEARGFTRTDFDRLASLQAQKLSHYEDNFDADESFEWHGGYDYIVTGKK